MNNTKYIQYGYKTFLNVYCRAKIEIKLKTTKLFYLFAVFLFITVIHPIEHTLPQTVS